MQTKAYIATDYEIIRDRNFFGRFTPGGSFQSSSYDVTASYDVIIHREVCCDVMIQTLGASAGCKAAEKISYYIPF